MTGRFFRYIAVLCVLIAAAGLFSPAMAADTGSWQKIFIVDFIFDDHGVTEESSGIWYGIAPDPAIQSGPIEGIVADSQNRPLTTFYLHDPRYQIGDALVKNPDGSVSVAGYSQYTPTVEIRTVFPYYPEAKSLSLVDTRTGTVLATSDLGIAGTRLAEMYPEELEYFEHVTYAGSANTDYRPVIFLFAGIGMVAASGLLYLQYTRRYHTGNLFVLYEKQKNIAAYARSLLGKRGLLCAGCCKKIVDTLYHTSVLINFAIIFVLVYVILHSSLLIVSQYAEGMMILLLILLEIPAVSLLEVSLVTTHRTLVNRGSR